MNCITSIQVNKCWIVLFFILEIIYGKCTQITQSNNNHKNLEGHQKKLLFNINICKHSLQMLNQFNMKYCHSIQLFLGIHIIISITFLFKLNIIIFMNFIIFIFSFFVLAHSSLTITNSAIVPAYAGVTTASYSFSFLVQGQIIHSGYQFIIKFPTNSFIITKSSNCIFYIDNNNVTDATCSQDLANNQIIFSNIATASISPSNISISFSSSGALFATNTLLDMYFTDSLNNTITSSVISVVLSIAPTQVTSCSITSSSNITGVSNSWQFSFTPNVPILSGQIFQIVLPLWGFNNTSNFVNSTPICTGFSCTASISGSYQYLTITNLFNSTTSNMVTINVNGIKNPISTAPITTEFDILTTSQNYVQICTYNFSVNTPNSFKTISFTNSNKSISANNSITLMLTIMNPISSSCYLNVATSLPISYSYVPVSLNKPVLVNSSSNLLLSNITTSTNLNPGSLILIGNFILTNPPYGNVPINVKISTQILINGSYYSIDSSSVGISSVPSTITQATVIMANLAVNTISSYLIQFTNINSLISTSLITIIFPQQTTLYSNTTCVNTYTSCNVYPNNNTVIIQIGFQIASSSNIMINITSVKNPVSTQSSSTFKIYTYYDNNYYLIDSLTQGLYINAGSVQISKATISASSLVVMQSSVQYNFSITCTNPIFAGTLINITFPSEIPLNSTITTYSSLNILPCNMNIVNQSIILQNCIITTTSSTILIIIQGITNPSSTKVTSNFNITTYYNTNLIQYLNPPAGIQMTTPQTLLDFTVVSNTTTVNSNATYTFSITFATIHYSNDKIFLIFADGILINTPIKCMPIIGLSSISCSILNSTTIQIITIYSQFPADYRISFNISSFTNNWYSNNCLITCVTAKNDTVIYYVQQASFNLTFLPANLTILTITNQQIMLLGNSTINVNITSPFILSRATDPTLTYLTISFPSTSFTAIQTNYSINFGVCNYSSTLNGYTISNILTFPTTFIANFLVYTLYFSNLSDSIAVKLYYNGSIIAQNTFNIQVYCMPPCQSCTSNPTQCLSCLPIPYTLNNSYIPTKNICTQTCPDGTYFSTSGVCINCTTNCNTCMINSSTCLTCVSNYYLLNYTCYSKCPNTYYQSNTNCLSCISPCLFCSSNITCLSCISNYYFYKNSCVLSCTDITTIPLNYTCTSCNGTCLSCSQNINNCTSCQGTLILINNTCLSSCPAGTYLVLDNCLNCITPCVTCTTISICTSCYSSQYLYNNSCISVCPSGTIPLSTNCVACSSECLTCSLQITNCTSCFSTLYSLDSTCVASCPLSHYLYQSSCLQCTSPCYSCSNLPSICSSCITNYYLFGNVCVTICPQKYYLQNSTLSCQSCSQNCITCNSLSNCTTCISQYLILNGLCVNTCPLSNPILIGQTCKACNTQCQTCSLSTSNCTTCIRNMYKFTYTCLSTCPLGMYGNSYTSTCQYLTPTYVIIFFPFTITLFTACIMIVVSKLYSSNTVLITSIASISALLQICNWPYFLSTISTNTEQSLNTTNPIILVIIGLILLVTLNIVFYWLNNKIIKEDQYFKQWVKGSGANYITFMVFIHLSLILNLKIFRFQYSRLFNLIPLSMIFMHKQSIFPLTTGMTLLVFVFCQIPVIVSAINIIYFKNAKDQLFYNSIDCLLITSIAIIFGILDIYKEEQFFTESAFFKLKCYLENIKDSMIKQKQQTQLYGAKLNIESSSHSHVKDQKKFSKQRQEFQLEFNSYNNIYGDSVDQFNNSDHQTSELIDFSEETKKYRTVKKNRRINIFQPILEKEGDYQQYYSIDSLEKIMEQKERPKSEESKDEVDKQEYRKQLENDMKSLLQHKDLKRQWNKIIGKRKQQADKLYRTMEVQTINFMNEIYELKQLNEESQEEDQQNQKLQEIIKPVSQQQLIKEQNQKQQQNDYLEKFIEEYKQKKKIEEQKANEREMLEKLEKQKLQQVLEKVQKQLIENPLKTSKNEVINELSYMAQSAKESDSKQYNKYIDLSKNNELSAENEQNLPFEISNIKQLHNSQEISKQIKKKSIVLNRSMKKASQIYLQRLIPHNQSSKKSMGNAQRKTRKTVSKSKINLDF